MRELNKVLNKNEKVFWEGKPKFWPYFVGSSVIIILVWIFLSVLFFIPIFTLSRTFVATTSYATIFVPLAVIFEILILFAPIIYIGLVYKNIYYTVTDKRVIVQHGLVGRDFQFIDYDRMTNAQVNVGFFDKLFGGNSGSISIKSAGGNNYLSNVYNPYDVFKFFKKVSFDVKTDIKFPNKYRPKENPGYKTKYGPSDKE